MFNRAVVSIHETDLICLVESTDVYAGMIVEIVYIVGIFYYQHPFCRTVVNKIISETKMISACKLILSICAEFAVIWWIKKYKIILRRLKFIKECLKIKI